MGWGRFRMPQAAAGFFRCAQPCLELCNDLSHRFVRAWSPTGYFLDERWNVYAVFENLREHGRKMSGVKLLGTEVNLCQAISVRSDWVTPLPGDVGNLTDKLGSGHVCP